LCAFSNSSSRTKLNGFLRTCSVSCPFESTKTDYQLVIWRKCGSRNNPFTYCVFIAYVARSRSDQAGNCMFFGIF
jgi:hypothetical protein